MRASIAMATYNGAKYLQAQLDSFLAQTRLPDELIITDDGSTDDTLDIIKRFAETAPFPVIYSQNEKNLGYGGNFNASLQKTTGDLVFLSDQDDVWFPEKIARMVALAEAEPNALVLMNDAVLTDEDLKSTRLTKLGQIHSAGFSKQDFVMGCCAAIRRDLLDICLPIPAGIRCHDSWIVEIADGLKCKRILAEVLQYYRRHGENQSQVIVNRTTRVTRWHVLVDEWRYRLQQLSKYIIYRKPVLDNTTHQWELLLERVQDVSERVPDYLKANILSYQKELLQLKKLLIIRQDIRCLHLSSRLLEAFLFWRKGGYASFSGIKSAIRDIFGT